MSDTSPLETRIDFRAPEFYDEYVTKRADGSTWANESQVARDMMLLGIIHSELAATDDVYLEESPVRDWERPQGKMALNDRFVCPNCANSNKWLFVIRNEPVTPEVVGVECLACGHMDLPEVVDLTLPEDFYWAQSGPHDHWHLVNPERRRTLCNRYNDEGLRAADGHFGPNITDRPTNICHNCWMERVSWDDLDPDELDELEVPEDFR